MQPWLNCKDSVIRLTLHVQPGAKKTELAGEHGGALKLRLAAPPVEGKANTVLLAWLAERFGVPKRDVALVSGDKSRHKIVEIDLALDEAAVLARLGF
ncbi:MAG: YggU family protein [Pseudogulbenkiania sp.]|nr:YggU family protein [Pseudogulbenkiania sp.]